MIVKLLTEHHLEFLSFKEAAQARLSLHLSNATLLEITCRGSFSILQLCPILLPGPAQHEKSLGFTCNRLVPLYSYSI